MRVKFRKDGRRLLRLLVWFIKMVIFELNPDKVRESSRRLLEYQINQIQTAVQSGDTGAVEEARRRYQVLSSIFHEIVGDGGDYDLTAHRQLTQFAGSKK